MSILLRASINKAQTILDNFAVKLYPNKLKWLYIFITWRFLLVLLMVISQATVLQHGQWTQYLYFRYVAELSDQHYYPLINQWIEYPPVFPWLSVGLYQFASLFVTGTLKYVIFYGLLGLVFAISECGILIFIFKIGSIIYTPQKATLVAFIFGVTALPTYISYGWFDPIATFFLFWGLERLLNKHYHQSAFAIALGGLTKLFPLLLIVVGFKMIPSIKQKFSYLFLSIIFTISPFIAFAFVNADAVMASLRWLLNKSTYETVWALIDGYYSYGVAPGASDFINMSSANWVAHSTKIPWTFVTGIFAIFGLYIYSRPFKTHTQQVAVILSGIIIQMIILYLKGFSPQFIIWFLPFVPLILPNVKGFLYSISLSLLNFLEFPIYFSFLEGHTTFLGSIIVIRTILTLIIAFEYWKIYQLLSATQFPVKVAVKL